MNYERMRQQMVRSFERTDPLDSDIVRRMAERRAKQPPRANAAMTLAWAALLTTVPLVLGVFAPWRSLTSPSLRATEERWTPNSIGPNPPRGDRSPTETPRAPAADGARTGATRIGAQRRGAAPPKSTPQAAPPAALSPALGEDESSLSREAHWENIARALREGDERKAKTLAGELGESSDAETRDNARLTFLRLELGPNAASSASEANIAELRRLRETGSTSSVRASARRLLEQLNRQGSATSSEQRTQEDSGRPLE